MLFDLLSEVLKGSHCQLKVVVCFQRALCKIVVADEVALCISQVLATRASLQSFYTSLLLQEYVGNFMKAIILMVGLL